MDHPILKRMEPEALDASTSDGTVVMLLNAGPFHAAITRLSRERMHPLFGSSANLSLSGTKFRVEDIEPEVIGIADVVIDHGLRLFHLYRASSTLLDLETFEVVRHGACFELIADVLKRRFGIGLPPPAPRAPPHPDRRSPVAAPVFVERSGSGGSHRPPPGRGPPAVLGDRHPPPAAGLATVRGGGSGLAHSRAAEGARTPGEPCAGRRVYPAGGGVQTAS